RWACDQPPVPPSVPNDSSARSRQPLRMSTGPARPIALDIVKPAPAPTLRGHTALGGLLVDRGLITPEQLEIAITEQKSTGRRLGRVRVDRGVLTPEVLLEVLSEQLGVPTARINAYTVCPEAIASLPEKVARRHTAFPLQRTGTTLVVAL